MPPRGLPCELERMIFLLVPSKMGYGCLTVAKRVHVWVEPQLYRVVCLTTDKRARDFLRSMLSRPEFALNTVEGLCLNIAVGLDTATAILTLCSRIKSLNMRFPCHLYGKNPILKPLLSLTRLAVLHVDLSAIFNTKLISLPDVPVFHSVTHLHLSNAWATWSPTASLIGLERLTQITHLSLYLSTVRTLPHLLKEILGRSNLSVLVLWKRSFVPDSTAVEFLEESNLQDSRMIVLDEGMCRNHLLDGGFWECAERVVKQRQETAATFSPCDANLIAPCVVQYANAGCLSEMERVVQTDVESSSGHSSDESGNESSG